MSLIELPEQTTATIAAIHADTSYLSLLDAIGITPQRTIIKLYRSYRKNPVVVYTAHHSNFALGYDLAASITVTLEN